MEDEDERVSLFLHDRTRFRCFLSLLLTFDRVSSRRLCASFSEDASLLELLVLELDDKGDESWLDSLVLRIPYSSSLCWFVTFSVLFGVSPLFRHARTIVPCFLVVGFSDGSNGTVLVVVFRPFVLFSVDASLELEDTSLRCGSSGTSWFLLGDSVARMLFGFAVGCVLSSVFLPFFLLLFFLCLESDLYSKCCTSCRVALGMSSKACPPRLLKMATIGSCCCGCGCGAPSWESCTVCFV